MNEHKGHRQRLKNEFLINGLDGFEDHKILEILTSFSIPRTDTNVLAHRLIARFGSMHGVLEASYDELLEVEGVGEKTAYLLSVVSEISRREQLAKFAGTERYTTVESVGRLLCSIYKKKSREQVYMLMFNGRMELLGIETVGIGSFNSSSVSAGALIESALKNRAAGIVLGHNHPSGVCLPSSDDINLTAQIEHLCSQVDIELLEHFIVSGNSYMTIMHGRQFGAEE